MDRKQVSALSLLGEKAKEEGVRLELTIFGGSALMLAYGVRDATKDIDAIMKPKEIGERLAEEVAFELNLPEDWLNSSVEQFVSPTVQARQRLLDIEEKTGLIIHVPTAKYLLAMKALACRRPIGRYEGDFADLRFLIRKMNIHGVAEIQEAIDTFYPDDPISEANALVLKRLIKEAHED